MNNEYEHVTHGFAPVYDGKSRVLILGTLPSVKSRESRFYYGHPQNRFWKVLSRIYEEETPESVQDKTEFLLRNHVALWDVIEECDIVGSSDSSIKNVVPADIGRILAAAPIKAVYANGAAAHALYMKHIFKTTNREIIRLPSTSPANAAFGLDRLVEVWKSLIRMS